MEKEYGKPLGDRVLLRMIDKGDEPSPSGLILRTSSEGVKKATVVSISDGYVSNNGNWVHIDEFETGDTVLIPDGINSVKIRVEGETLHLVNVSDILMVI